MQFGLNAFNAIIGGLIYFMFPETQYLPSISPIVVIFNPVFLLNIWQVMPVVTIALYYQLFFWKGKISDEWTYNILRLWCQPNLSKCISHFDFYAAYPGHIQCSPDPSTLSATETKSAHLTRCNLFQSPAYLALNCYSSVLFCIVMAFIAAIVSLVGAFLDKVFPALWTDFCSRRLTLSLIPSTNTIHATPRRIIFHLPGRNLKGFIALLAYKSMPFTHCNSMTSHATIYDFKLSGVNDLKGLIANRAYFCDVRSRLIKAITTTKLAVSMGGKNGEGFIALLTGQYDRMILHEKLPFLCHAIGCFQHRDGIILSANYTMNRPHRQRHSHDADWGHSIYEKPLKALV